MLGRKGLTTLALVTLVLVLAAVLSRQGERTADSAVQGGPFLPGLLARANDVASALVKTGTGEVTLERADGVWRVAEKHGYPADAAQIRALILGLAGLERIEPKTSNPDLYQRLGLRDVTEAGAQSTLLQLLDDGGQALATVVTGKRKPDPGEPGRVEIYARQPGDPQTWLLSGRLPEARSVSDWLDREPLALPQQDIRALEVRHVGGERVRLSRQSAQDADFAIADLASGEQPDSQFAVNNVAASFARLSIADVVPAADHTLTADKTTSVVVETFTGLRISADFEQQEDRVLARLEAEFDPKLRTIPAADAGAAAASADPPASGEPPEKEAAGTSGPPSPATQAERWNRLWQDWIYVVPSYQFDSIAVSKADLMPQATSAEQADGDSAETRTERN